MRSRMLRNGLLLLGGATCAVQAIRPNTPMPIAQSVVRRADPNDSESLEPCAVVSAAAAKATKAAAAKADEEDKAGPFTVAIPASDAMACLKSVPIVDRAGNIQLLDELKYWWQFESNLGWYKDPPPQMKDRQLDLIKRLEEIKAKLIDGTYSSEYAFMREIWMLTNLGRDFHFFFTPDILSVFSFSRGDSDELALISISKDGQELPQIYNYQEVMKENATGLPSPIKAINGKPVEEFLSTLLDYPQYNDIDARYNQLVVSQASIASGNGITNTFNLNSEIESNETVITYANDVKVPFTNYAMTDKSFKGVKDGLSFFKTFCTPAKSAKTSRGDGTASRRSLSPRSVVEQIGFPEPIIAHTEQILAGYFLEEEGYRDTAVLSVTSFDPKDSVQFQDIVHNFISNATAAEKTRLIIDLRNNGGGQVFLGFDLFHQLFPTTDMKHGTRIRQHEAWNEIADITTNSLQDYTREEVEVKCNLDPDLELCNLWTSDWNWRLSLNNLTKQYSSPQEYFGPYPIHNDNFTALVTYNFSDPLADSGFNMTGFFNRTKILIKQQPFAAENITLLQDGGCGSTCAIFSELMKAQGKVAQVVVGGRPHYGPMQGVCGSKGAEVRELKNLLSTVTTTIQLVEDPKEQTLVNQGSLGLLSNSSQIFSRGASANVNWRSNVRPGDKTDTPLEWVYEAADCRLFYTREMIRDVTKLWETSRDAMWKDAGLCVKNSTGHPSSLTGGMAIDAYPPGMEHLDDTGDKNNNENKTVGDWVIAEFGGQNAANGGRSVSLLQIILPLLAAVLVTL